MNAIYLQRRFTARIARITGISLLVLFIAGYAIWRSLNYARGPEISILSPMNGTSITSSTTEITGKVERAVHISLNGKPINIDEDGNFKETLIVFKGVNIITLEAKDQFDRGVQTEINLFGL